MSKNIEKQAVTVTNSLKHVIKNLKKNSYLFVDEETKKIIFNNNVFEYDENFMIKRSNHSESEVLGNANFNIEMDYSEESDSYKDNKENINKRRGGKKKKKEAKADDIIIFLTDYIEDENKVELVDFDIPHEDYRRNFIKKMLVDTKGHASKEVYQNLFNIAHFEKTCIKRKLPYMEYMKSESVGLYKKSLSAILKRSRRFFHVAQHCKHWTECKVAPSYWDDISEELWNSILGEFDLVAEWEEYMKLINQ
ncbi:hypothetical protein RclHR1_29490002 [Rhizophagus clarus]|uniref:Uncharacterized protein n=1 Tax=Rhizophagus clarus TaxID=94130 RepID=A0A2Z6R591_9GLOM|nr:hypothetical protein RclHR1_29490002 [Rhizophagus clarus]